MICWNTLEKYHLGIRYNCSFVLIREEKRLCWNTLKNITLCIRYKNIAYQKISNFLRNHRDKIV